LDILGGERKDVRVTVRKGMITGLAHALGSLSREEIVGVSRLADSGDKSENEVNEFAQSRLNAP
jgi:hypothetical protein